MTMGRVPGPEELAEDVREVTASLRSLEGTIRAEFAKLDERYLTRPEFNLYWGFVRQEQTRSDTETKEARQRAYQARVIALTGVVFPLLVAIIVLVLTQVVTT